MKILSTLFLLILLQVCSGKAIAQTHLTDSLVYALNEKIVLDTNRVVVLNKVSSLLYQGYPDSAKKYAKESITLARQLNYKKGVATAYRMLGSAFFIQRELDSALFYFNHSLNVFSEMEDERGIATMNASKGSVYAVNRNFELAIESFLEAIDSFDRFGNVASMGVMYNNIGNLYLEQKLYAQALENYKKATEVLSEPGHARVLSLVYTNLTLTSFELGNYKESLNYAELGIPIAIEHQRLYLLPILYSTIGNVYRDTNNYEEAFKNYELALEYNTKIGDPWKDLELVYFLALTEEKLGEVGKAKSHLIEVLKRVDKTKMDKLKSDALLLLSTVERTLGNSDDAYEYLVQAKHIADSLNQKELGLKIAELETKYETEKKEAQIELLEVQNKLANLRTLIFGILGFVITIIVSTSIWVFYRKKAEEKRIKLETVKKELQQFGLVIAEKNKFISAFRDDLEEIKKHVKTLEGRKEIISLVDQINQNSIIEQEEEELFTKIERVNEGFYTALRQINNDLTANDERLATLVQMELSNKDIANILHIEPQSVKQAKRRLKKKLQLAAEVDLHEYLNTLAA